MARCLDPKGRDGRLLAKKIKEHIAESQSRKQEEGRKISNTGGSWKQRRFVELHEQIERLVAELPPAKERTEEQNAELQRIVKEKCKMKKKLEILGEEKEADAVAKEAEQEQEQEQVEVHSKKIESSPAKNQKGKKKMGRPSKNEERSNKVKFYRNR